MTPVYRLLGIALCAAAACSSPSEAPNGQTSGAERLTARPRTNVTTVQPGLYGLRVAVHRDAFLLIPESAPSNAEIPLVVMLHGAGGTPASIDTVRARAESMGFAVLTPQSRAVTWDVALGQEFGEDVVIINKALDEAFKLLRVDPARIALAGFSDGASYALTLGLANGDLFSHVIAFSPGFLRSTPRHGKPTVFVAHGRDDFVLPIETTSSVIVPQLRALGYNVRYDEFDGGHRTDPAEATLAFQWLLGQ